MTDTDPELDLSTLDLSTPDLTLTDVDGDKLDAYPVLREDGQHYGVSLAGSAVHLDRATALALYHHLGDWLMATVPETEDAGTPDAEADGYSWGPAAESIALEAHRAVYGDRGRDYGHPREDFTRQAIMWTALLSHKLQDGAYIEAEDIGRCMIAVKLARDVHAPKRDNRVDMAGYALTLDRLETGK